MNDSAPEKIADASQPAFLHPKFIILAIVLLTVIATVAVRRHRWQIGMPGQYVWLYYEARDRHVPEASAFFSRLSYEGVIAAAPALFFVGVLLAGILLICRHGEIHHEWLAVGVTLLFCLGLILKMGDCGYTGPYETAFVTTNPSMGGYYAESLRVTDMREYIRDYDKRIESYPWYSHIAGHPPGKVVFHWLVNRFMANHPGLAQAVMPPAEIPDAPSLAVSNLAEVRALCDKAVADANVGDKQQTLLSDSQFAGIWASGILLRLALWLSLVPLYFIARRLFSPLVALVALVLASLIPSLHLFSPHTDLMIVLAAMLAVLTWLLALERLSIIWASLSAAVTTFGLLWSLTFLSVIALMGAFTVLHIWSQIAHGRKSWPGIMRPILAFAVTFLILSFLPTFFFGYKTWRVWSICLAKHAEFVRTINRTYFPWVLFNIVEFLLFCGVPCALLMLSEAGRDFRRWWHERRSSSLALLPWTLLAVIAALDISGQNRGEVSRLWMHMMPLAAIPAANALVALDRKRGWVLALILACGAVQLFVFRLHLNVFSV